uniref:MARVEL domain-containing protein n=1 Tax=Lates calcarifer TaxID=8187 RepID=A0A4W6G524_LATCA
MSVSQSLLLLDWRSGSGSDQFQLKQLLSFVAFILEEVVSSCISCTALYFFEFVSCTAFLFTLLLLVLLSTTLHTRVGITCWPSLDFYYTAAITLLFFISSIVFAANNNGNVVWLYPEPFLKICQRPRQKQF